jgi:hypothetical protein
MSGERTTAFLLASLVAGLLGSFDAGATRASYVSTSAVGCATSATVPLRLQSEHADALVSIDDQYVGKLGEIARRSIKLPTGTYRLTVEKVGFFPFDRIVVVEGDALMLAVDLEKIPD